MSDGVTTKQVRIMDIIVPQRIRKRAEQIGELAADIREHGLINPITVMDAGDGSYVLIAGKRRLDAVQRLGEHIIRATVLSPMAADEALMLEYAENEQRQDFTVAERLEYAERIKAVEKAKGIDRMSAYAREGRREGVVVRTHPETGPLSECGEKGKSRDAIAKRVGISSGVQLRRAMVVAEKKPELLEKIDSGETTIFGAYREVTAQPHDTPITSDGTEPSTSATPTRSDQVARARHERLMKNPIYADLFTRYDEAVKEANQAKGELRFQVEGYEKVIRGHKENIRTIIRERDRLLAENLELRARLGLSETEPVIITENNIV